MKTFVLAVWGLLALFAASSFAQSQDDAKADEAKPNVPKVEMLTCNVLILDPDGNPIEDATVSPSGLRTKAQPGGHWIWQEKQFGTVPKRKTNTNGLVEMTYPKFIQDKLEIGKVTWSVNHPDFVPFRDDRSVDDKPAEIKLERGFRIAVTAVDEKGEKVKQDLFALVSGMSGYTDWKLHDNGMLVSPVFAKSQATLRVIHIPEGQPPRFSKAIDVSPGEDSRVLLKDVKVSLGTRLEGKLSDAVERPVKNGYVVADIVRLGKDPRDWSGKWFWKDSVDVAEDGSFVFESLPGDEVVQLFAFCDGWLPDQPKRAEIAKFFPGEDKNLNHFGLPQIIELKHEKVEATIGMNRGSNCRLTVTDTEGNPIADATLYATPNQYNFGAGSTILGNRGSMPKVLVANRNGTPLKTAMTIPRRFKGKTDENGVGTLEALPTGRGIRFSVGHKKFKMVNTDRRIEVKLEAGKISEVDVKMEKKKTLPTKETDKEKSK